MITLLLAPINFFPRIIECTVSLYLCFLANKLSETKSKHLRIFTLIYANPELVALIQNLLSVLHKTWLFFSLLNVFGIFKVISAEETMSIEYLRDSMD
jgi:hypothetical protein